MRESGDAKTTHGHEAKTSEYIIMFTVIKSAHIILPITAKPQFNSPQPATNSLPANTTTPQRHSPLPPPLPAQDIIMPEPETGLTETRHRAWLTKRLRIPLAAAPQSQRSVSPAPNDAAANATINPKFPNPVRGKGGLSCKMHVKVLFVCR